MQDDNPTVPVANAGMTFGGDPDIPKQYFANAGAGNPGDSPVGVDWSMFKGAPQRHPVHKLADAGALHLITQVVLGKDPKKAIADFLNAAKGRNR